MIMSKFAVVGQLIKGLGHLWQRMKGLKLKARLAVLLVGTGVVSAFAWLMERYGEDVVLRAIHNANLMVEAFS